jgi:hypothetical protein
VHRRIDGHVLVDAVLAVRVSRIDSPSRVQLDEWQQVRRIAVYLVRAGEDECGIGTVQPRHFQRHERTVGIDGKVGDRFLRGPVVRRLRGGMDDQRNVAPVSREHLFHGGRVADVSAHVAVTGHLALEHCPAPCRAAVFAEEVPAHVVVDADDVEPLAGKEECRLSSDESSGAGNQHNRHRLIERS